ncbi:hypothetical protein BEWA_019330 [Theileria equi strain WA]|uniref:CERLI1-like PH domain-containing protein n=1 Tax=Theileria equi strain WA TaxID=1537102 RepID=L0AV17_THEEQ|nr:hypothetical protein BEWA_019330 [Theileria equi strain WA]AFZ79088.1 hypothetical protein BEWA_019330 [Theileria equi strain WA]|eukprot:XP_004828754.1 hypothetical protein BEWA_019330 [Theileria equi strain WA]
MLFQQKVNVHIRQCDDKIDISLCKKGRWSYTSCGTVTISVEEEILAQNVPKRRTYTLVHDNKSASKLAMTIYKMDENIATMEITPLTLQVLIQSQLEGNVLEEEMLRGLEEMSDTERLRYFAIVISGPLKKMNSIGKKWTEYFFKPLEISPGYWEWCYWKSLEKYESGEECLGGFSFLAISVIVPDPKERRNFYIRYHNEDGEHGMIFKRVDRDRNVWTDGLFEFVERVREVYLKNPKFRNLKKAKKRIIRCKDLDPGVRFEDICKEVKSDDSKPNLNTTHTVMSPVNLITPEKKTLRDNIQIMASNMYKTGNENVA